MTFENDPSLKPKSVEVHSEQDIPEMLADQLQRLVEASRFITNVMKPDDIHKKKEKLTFKGPLISDNHGHSTSLEGTSLHITMFNGEGRTKYMLASLHELTADEELGGVLSKFNIILTKNGAIREFNRDDSVEGIDWYDILSSTAEYIEQAADQKIEQAFS